MTLIRQQSIKSDDEDKDKLIKVEEDEEIISFEIDAPPGTKFKCSDANSIDKDSTPTIEVGKSGIIRIDNTMLSGIERIKITDIPRDKAIVTYIVKSNGGKT